jgi:type II secretory pathway pseudopilin PulG
MLRRLGEEGGFTLTELLVGSLISLLALLALSALFIVIGHQTTSNTNLSEALQQADTAMQRIVTQLHEARLTPAAPAVTGTAGTGLGGATGYPELVLYMDEGSAGAASEYRVVYNCTGATDQAACFVSNTSCNGTCSASVPAGAVCTAVSATCQQVLGCGAQTAYGHSPLGSCANLISPDIFQSGPSTVWGGSWGQASTSWTGAGGTPVTIGLNLLIEGGGAARSHETTLPLIQTVTPMTGSCQQTACAS